MLLDSRSPLSPSSPDSNATKIERYPIVSYLHQLFSVFVNDLQTQDFGSGFFANAQTTFITGGTFVSHSQPPTFEDEVHRLRRRVRELELECNRNRNVIESLRRPVAIGLRTPSPSPSFQESWKARTEIRKKIFCSPNRAGNALCSWHDSRRERRAYPPCQDPPGYLNCGCSHEEALFEEILSRDTVGGYRPGDTVWMDPALHNPLPRMLENQFVYKDDDFERDPLMDYWIDGESPSGWELKARSGPANRQHQQCIDDRH